MKITKIMSPVASKIEFVNDYLQILSSLYKENNAKIADYYKNKNDLYDLNNHPEMATLLYTQIDIIHKISVGKDLKKDIRTHDYYFNSNND